ncbi:MAG: hypothetical protein HYW51_03025 [Candidatus Doudnabacteria bacterium]|nr:hypothetical protein [Candidatus Doudnabacteria bacterium]
MLNNEDIQKLSAVLATKEDLKDFYTKSDMDERFGSLQTAIDGLAKLVTDFRNEHVIIHKRLKF